MNTRMPSIGTRLLDRYEITGLLGEGGFGAVYKASDTQAGGEVAIKVLLAERSGDPEFTERFRQEVMLVRQLRHPNTIKIWDFGVSADGLLYMVMEYVEGRTLQSLLDQEGALSPMRAASIMRQTLQSLAEAHQMGIVHRDLKPGNIMVTQLPEGGDFVKVLDFGIAKAADSELSRVQTKTGLVMCTPRYAAPELLLRRDIAPGSDIYALGLILGEILMGHSPFRGMEEASIIALQLAPEPPAFPEELLATPLGQVVARATKKIVGERFSDALDMLKALRDVTDLSDTRTRMHSTPGKSQVTPGKRAWLTSKLALTLLLAGVSIAAILVYLIAFSHPTPPPSSEPSQVLNEPPLADTVPLVSEAVQLHVAPVFGFLGGAPATGESRVGEMMVGRDDSGNGGPIEGGPQTAQVETRVDASARHVELDDLTIEQIAVVGRQTTGEQEGTGADMSTERRSALLYRSAQYQKLALGLLSAALANGTADPQQRPLMMQQSLRMTINLIVTLTEMGLCTAAGHQLNQSIAEPALLPPDGVEQLGLMADRIASCYTDRILEVQPWDPGRFLELAQMGADLSAHGRNLPTDLGDQRDAYLSRGVDLMHDAISRLKSALLTGQIDPRLQGEATRELLQLHGEVIGALIAQTSCDAAEMELDEARADLSWLGASYDLSGSERDIRTCQVRLGTTQPPQWDQYSELAAQGEALYDEAVSGGVTDGSGPGLLPLADVVLSEGSGVELVPPPAYSANPILPVDQTLPVDPRLALLYQSARSVEQALALLETGLREGSIVDPQRQQAILDYLNLSDRQVVILLDLSMCPAAEYRLNSTLTHTDWLPPGGIDQLGLHRAAILTCYQNQAASTPVWDPAQFQRWAQTGANLSAMGRDMPADTGESRRIILERGAQLMRRATDMLRVALDAGLLDASVRDQAITQLMELHGQTIGALAQADLCSDAAFRLQQAFGDAAHLALAFDATSSEQEIAGCRTRLAVSQGPGFDQYSRWATEGDLLYQQAQSLVIPPELHQVRLRIRTTPSGARVVANGQTLGLTPFNGLLESEQDRMEVTLEKADYVTMRVEVDMTQSEYRRSFVLVQRHPFGRTHQIGD